MRRNSMLRRRNALAVHDLHYGPNMTPMVDVVMVILVFFMASASVLGPEWLLRTALPPAKRASSEEFKATTLTRVELALSVDGSGRTLARGSATDGEGKNVPELGLEPAAALTLGPWLAGLTRGREAESVAVVIKPDAGVPYEDVVKLHELCYAAGLTKVGLGQ